MGYLHTQFRELDTRIGIWWGRDPEPKAYESPYVSMGDNPIRNNDVKGNSTTDWVKGKDGHARYDKNVHKKSDVKNGEQYLGKNIFIKEKGLKNYYYYEQDKLKAIYNEGVKIVGKQTSGESSSTPMDRAMSQAIVAYQSPNFLSSNPLQPLQIPSLMPNAYGITGQVSFIPVMGATGSLSLGVVDHHFGVWGSVGPGVGADIGGSISLFAGYHTNNTKGGFNSYMGLSHSGSLGIGPLSVGGSTDISTINKKTKYGQNWDTFSMGLGMGLPVSGSTQLTVSKALFISH